MGLCISRVEGQRLLQGCARLCVAPLLDQPQRISDAASERRRHEGLLEEALRLDVFAELGCDLRRHRDRRLKIRSEGQRPRTLNLGLSESSQLEERTTRVAMRAGVPVFESSGRSKPIECTDDIATIEEQLPNVVLRARVLWVR